jgi:hypothetical protein
MTEEILGTPGSFRGIWLHKTKEKEKILSNGWNPLLNKNSIYGTAVYLSEEKWYVDDFHLCAVDHPRPIDRETIKRHLENRGMLVCVLALQANEAQSRFPSKNEPNGHTMDDLLEYLNINVPEDKSGPPPIRRIDSPGSRQFGRNSGTAKNRQNRRIADFFLKEGKKAVNFSEYGEEVVAIYDPSCIRVLPKTTDLNQRPFSDILVGGPGSADPQMK